MCIMCGESHIVDVWKALHDKYVKPYDKFHFMFHGDFYNNEGRTLQLDA